LLRAAYEFRDVDEGVTRDHVEAALAGPASLLTMVAMMTSCQCLARRVKWNSRYPKIILRA